MHTINVELVGFLDVDGGAEQGYALARGPESGEALRLTHRIYGAAESGGRGQSQALRLSLEELAVGLARGFLELTMASMDGADAAIAAQKTQALARELAAAANGEGRGSASALAPAQRDRIRVFHDLWARGYSVTIGSKFGADFLIYAGDPTRTHATALVVVKALDAPFPRVDLVSLGRVAKMVKKQLYVASVRPGEAGQRDAVVFVLLTHALLASRQEEEEEEEEEDDDDDA